MCNCGYGGHHHVYDNIEIMITERVSSKVNISKSTVNAPKRESVSLMFVCDHILEQRMKKEKNAWSSILVVYFTC